jgi:DNA repair exonuclease SbcCD ATPase subunit
VNGERIIDANKAQAKINEILGSNSELLDLYVFKEQHAIFDFLSKSNSERAKAYQVLFRTGQCEILWNMLGEFLRDDVDINKEVVTNTDELRVMLEARKESRKSLRSQENQLSVNLKSKKVIEKYEAVIRNAKTSAELREENEKHSSKIKLLKADLVTLRRVMQQVESDKDAAKKKFESALELAENAKRDLDRLERYTSGYSRLVSARKQLREAKAAEAALISELLPCDEIKEMERNLEEQRTSLVSGREQLERYRKNIETLTESQTVACPVCGTPTSALGDSIAEMQLAVASLPAKNKARETASRKLAAMLEAQTDKRSKLATIESEIKGIETSIASLTEDLGEPLVDNEASLKVVIAQASKAKEEYIEAKDRTTDANKRHGVIANELEILQRLFDTNEEKLKGIAALAISPKKAKSRLDKHRSAVEAVANIRGQLLGIKREIKNLTAQLAEARAIRSRGLAAKNMQKILTSARDVLHRDRLPRRVAESNLRLIEDAVNANLELFGSPFWATTAEDLSFLVNKPGEPQQAASRLSTGQKVVLALAFWSAVASLLGNELGLLALDEPTANLDYDNRILLRESLTTLSRKLKGSRQLILVTHDPYLRTAFDQVIDLSELTGTSSESHKQ